MGIYEQVQNILNGGVQVQKSDFSNIALSEKVERILKGEVSASEIEKGIRTVIVPPSNGRKGYQYQRNFPDNKRENHFKGKEPRRKRQARFANENSQIFTKKGYRELSESEKKDLIARLKNAHYYKKDGVFVAYGRKENSTGKDNFDYEFEAAKDMVGYGNTVYLVPEWYARDGNDKKDTADSILNDDFLEIKHAESNNGVRDRYADSRKQADNVYIDVKFESDINKVKNIIFGKIAKIKSSGKFNDKSFEGKVYIHLNNKTYQLDIDKNGIGEEPIPLSRERQPRSSNAVHSIPNISQTPEKSMTKSLYSQVQEILHGGASIQKSEFSQMPLSQKVDCILSKSYIPQDSEKVEKAGGKWGILIPERKMNSAGRMVTYWVNPEDRNRGKMKGQQNLFGDDELKEQEEPEGSYYSKNDSDTEDYQVKPLVEKFRQYNPKLAERMAEKYKVYQWDRETRDLDLKLDFETLDYAKGEERA